MIMTKKEFIESSYPFNEWLENHNKYVNETFKSMKPYFDIDGFLKYFSNKANEEVLKTLLTDAFNDYNDEPYERDDHLSRVLVVPITEVMKFELVEDFNDD